MHVCCSVMVYKEGESELSLRNTLYHVVGKLTSAKHALILLLNDNPWTFTKYMHFTENMDLIGSC